MGNQYQWSLKEVARRGGNLGVLLGGGLVTIDFDDPADIEPFEEAFPWAKHTTTTVGAKGCQKWFRIKGQYPEERIILKQKEGQATLEFRGGGGHQSVCYGVHKNGKDVYKFVVDVPPKEIEWEEIRPWIESFAPEAGHSADNSGGNGNGSKPPGQDEDWSWLKKFPRCEIRDLDLRGLLQELGIVGVTTPDANMFAVECPWKEQHTSETGWKQTVIYQWPKVWFPAFDCKHAHCAGKSLRHVVEWAQDLSPGIVERYCKGRKGLPALVDHGSIIETKPVLPKEVIGGLLHEGMKMMVAGPAKMRKSWLAMDLGLSMSLGIPWMGFDTVSSRVLILNMEMPQVFFEYRLYHIQQAKHLSKMQKGTFSALHMRGNPALDGDWSLLAKLVKKEGIEVVIIDPIYKVLGERDENSARDMANLLRNVDTVAECGAAIIEIHHFAKGDSSQKEVGDRASGSGVFFRDPDAFVTVSHANDQRLFDQAKLEARVRMVTPIDPIGMRWEFP